MMRKKLFGKIGTIKKAPHRQKLEVFGGNMSIEQFRENNVKDEEIPIDTINIEPIPEINIPIVANISNEKRLKDINRSSGNNETLRLKREKPLKRNQNNLETVLGLVIKTKP